VGPTETGPALPCDHENGRASRGTQRYEKGAKEKGDLYKKRTRYKSFQQAERCGKRNRAENRQAKLIGKPVSKEGMGVGTERWPVKWGRGKRKRMTRAGKR